LHMIWPFVERFQAIMMHIPAEFSGLFRRKLLNA
jgi:hypothetical protein